MVRKGWYYIGELESSIISRIPLASFRWLSNDRATDVTSKFAHPYLTPAAFDTMQS